MAHNTPHSEPRKRSPLERVKIADPVKFVSPKLDVLKKPLFTGMCRLFRHERQKRENTRPLDRFGNRPLMLGTRPGNAARKNLAPLGDKPTEGVRLFIVNFEFLGAKPTDFFLKKDLATPAAAPIVLVAIAVVVSFTTAIPVSVKRTITPAIGTPLQPARIHLCFTGACIIDIVYICRYFRFLIRHIFLL
jgi:hypothetical protein